MALKTGFKDSREQDSKIPLQPALHEIWDSKYRLKDQAGRPLDGDIDATYRRVARALAEVEVNTELQNRWYERFLWALRQGAIPAGRILSNAGALNYKPATSTINCTVSDTIPDSMDGILGKLHEAGMTLKSGAGIGYEFSTLRPRGAYVTGAGSHTSGPLSFMDIFDRMCFTISSAGGRRGAQMATFDVGHPDVFDFIRAKREDGRLRQFNLSLLITEEFMSAVEADTEWPLSFPLTPVEVEAEKLDLNDAATVIWRDWPRHEGYVSNDKGKVACRIYRKVKAVELWECIMRSTYDYAEPGFILIDRYNELNNNWFCENIRATNPCGEQGLPPYGACWTGSMRINTNYGLIRTEDAMALVEQGKPLLVGVDDLFSRKKTDLRPCTLVRNGEREVFEIHFSNGQRIELTADHRVYTPRGWKETRELKIGNAVHMQTRELSHLDLASPFDLGSLKYLFDRHEGSFIVITHAARRAFAKPLLDRLCVNYNDRQKGLFVSRNHALICEVERLDLISHSKEEVLQGYLYAAICTGAYYENCPAVFGSHERIQRLADVAARVTGETPAISHHGKGTYRLLLPTGMPLLAPPIQQRSLNLDCAMYGWLMADGWLTDSAGLVFSDQDDAAMQMLAPHFAAITGTNGSLRRVYSGERRDVYSLACYRKEAVRSLRKTLGLSDYTSRVIRVPEKIFQADTDGQASFLSAVFCADGSIDVDKICIRLTSASERWLEDIQVLLLNFGIHGGIQAQISKGNAFYSLRLSQADAYRFWRHIGFCFNSTKQHKLERLLREKQRWHKPGSESMGTVVSIRSIGLQPVYDIEEPSTHTLIVNGVVVHNCLLGSINLVNFVKQPFTEDADFDWPLFGEVVKVFTRMLDNVVELNGLPLPEQQREILSKRRHGMGFLGLGSALTMLGIAYGSGRSLTFTEQVSRELAVNGWRAALELSREKGPAPIMRQDFTVTGEMLARRPEMRGDGWTEGAVIKGSILHARYSRYMQQLAAIEPELVSALAAEGARFTHHSSIAPTGTIALSLGNNVSNGIEPSFAHHYQRNVIRAGKKTKQQIDVFSYELLAYRQYVNPDAMPFTQQESARLPDYFVAADDVTPQQHVDVQAAAQKWIDSSISKTANVPTDYPYEDFKQIYRYAWRQGLKGCTTFRFNPVAFQGVLVKEQDLKNTRYRFTLEDSSVIEARGNEEIEYEGEIHTAANLHDALKEGYYGKF